MVVSEASYLINSYLGNLAEIGFVNSLINRELLIENVSIGDLTRSVELLQKYDEHNIGLVDAMTVATSERLKISMILTTDRRHFSVIKPIHCKAFTLLP